MLDFLSAGKLRKHDSVGGKNWCWRAVLEGPNNAVLGQQCLMTPKERVKEYLLCGQIPTRLELQNVRSPPKYTHLWVFRLSCSQKTLFYTSVSGIKQPSICITSILLHFWNTNAKTGEVRRKFLMGQKKGLLRKSFQAGCSPVLPPYSDKICSYSGNHRKKRNIGKEWFHFRRRWWTGKRLLDGHYGCLCVYM